MCSLLVGIHTEVSLESEGLAEKHWWLCLPTLKVDNGGVLTMLSTTCYQSIPELAPLMSGVFFSVLRDSVGKDFTLQQVKMIHSFCL